MVWREPRSGRSSYVRAELTMAEGKIVSWVKSEGDQLSKARAWSPRVSPHPSALPSISWLSVRTRSRLPRPVSGRSESQDPSPPPPPSPPSPPPPFPSIAPSLAPVAFSSKKIATPNAKKFAKKHKVDRGAIVRKGPCGRITPSDVEATAGIQPKKLAASSAPCCSYYSESPTLKALACSFPEIPGSSVIPFTTMQAAVSKNMIESLLVPAFIGYPVARCARCSLLGAPPVKKTKLEVAANLVKRSLEFTPSIPGRSSEERNVPGEAHDHN